MDEILQDLRALFLFILHALQHYASTPEGMTELQALIEEFADDLPWNKAQAEPAETRQAGEYDVPPTTFDPSTMSRSEWLKQQEGK